MVGNSLNSLNWTTEVYCLIFADIGIFIALLCSIWTIWKGNRYRYIFFTMFVWIFYLLNVVFWTLAPLFKSPLCFNIGCYFTTIAGFFFLLVADSLARDAADPIKLMVYTFFAPLRVVATFQPDSAIISALPNGDITIIMNPMNWLSHLPIFFFPGFVYIYYILRMNQQAPKSLKKYSHLFVAGLFLGFFTFDSLWFLGKFGLVHPGIPWIFCGVGCMMMGFVIAYQPRLIFILPFKAIRLSVVHTESGIPLYNHNWTEDGLINEDLYTGMLQGVNIIMRESLNQGDLQELALTQATLITYRPKEHALLFVIVAKKKSKTLRDALKIFADMFIKSFHGNLKEYQEVGNFAAADQLIASVFPFVPDYD